MAVAVCFILFMLLFRDVCPTQILFGMPCPGCGLTRAGILLLSGDFSGAWKMHPFIYAWAALVIYIVVCRYLLGRKTPWLMQMIVVLVIAMLLYYIYRMMRYFPDVEPMTRKTAGIFRLLPGILGGITF